ncbi:uncharacterized protein LOC124898598 [Capsicum annuum]|uniref:uncharacterized protein LOC107872023 n=1 Tax=Capsicum annuum TaxID=4072 RepID=UPI001FB140D1|nr:uncharacterized protein LOC107872023 [Capsicum annuum]XP_047262158.1 uncharacterized protein LOC124895774 [Capsicum annuum]XP_047262180.1 uncharacterized protein LOC124895801 [Capsicum annuum]XP_047262193.1 uncharacterized protein LOC124895826 [Capsicum annuum]XP_047262215.1 uncharacterized protein LOC124895856 [Capsicum annuum]XP_047268189.1 uncharacterized protein LOC124898598 [Capsicum annuum]
MEFTKALCDLGASVNLIPLNIYNKLGLGNPTPTNMRLVMADRSVKRPVGILYDVLVKVSNFIFPADFVILDYKVDFEVTIILGRLFLTIGSVLIDLIANELFFTVNDEVVRYNVGKSMKQHEEMSLFSVVDLYFEDEQDVLRTTQLVIEPLAVVVMNYDSEGIEEYEEIVFALTGLGSYSYTSKKLELDLANRPTSPTKPSIEEPLVLELKKLPGHL